MIIYKKIYNFVYKNLLEHPITSNPVSLDSRFSTSWPEHPIVSNSVSLYSKFSTSISFTKVCMQLISLFGILEFASSSVRRSYITYNVIIKLYYYFQITYNYFSNVLEQHVAAISLPQNLRTSPLQNEVCILYSYYITLSASLILNQLDHKLISIILIFKK